MQAEAIAIFSKPGDARGEVQQIVDRAALEAGTPINDGIHALLYLHQADVTVAELNGDASYLKEQLLNTPGWRNETK